MMIDLSQFKKRIVYERLLPPHPAEYADFPAEMAVPLKNCLRSIGIERLYSHQAEMFELVQSGNNTVITTSTASGKTLAFLLPIVQSILNDPSIRAIFLYPTKALAADQFRAMLPFLEYFGTERIQAGIYDGDTPVAERSRLRSNANIILTNPDMLNSAFLPNHSRYGFDFLFSNLRYIVIDELHSYRGAFGSHLSNVFRRLSRISHFYHATTQFLCSSATIANPVELASRICGVPFICIEHDGSPAPTKRFELWQPPAVKGGSFRVSPAREAARLVPSLIEQGSSLIAFCKSRNTVEVVLKEAQDALKGQSEEKDHGTVGTNPPAYTGPDRSGLISGYRGGYQPLERREIEQKMADGRLRGLIATNVLELGIDIGSLDTAVLVGFPGTRASFWQQSGRAGRKGSTATTFLLMDNLPMDQYLAIDPEWLFSGGSESAVVDPNNLFIQLAHVRAAAAELPLSLDDGALFPDLGEIVPILAEAGELTKQNGRWFWSGSPYPSGDFSLRNIDKLRYKLKNLRDNAVLTEMDELDAYREIYKGAIYMHRGRQYLVESMDRVNALCEARPIDVNYYTISCDNTEVQALRAARSVDLGRVTARFGDVKVAYTTWGFRRLQFHNHQNLGYEKLDEPLTKSFETEGLWITLPPEVRELYMCLSPAESAAMRGWKTYMEGLGFALQNAAFRVTMATPSDLGAAALTDESGATAVCLFDMYSGGLGFCDKAFDQLDDILVNAAKAIEGCPCRNGCSACVGDYHLDKRAVLWGLKSLFEILPPPQNLKPRSEAPEPLPEDEKPFQLVTLPDHWQEFCDAAAVSEQYLGKFIRQVKTVSVRGGLLTLTVSSRFYADWLNEETNRLGLEALIRRDTAVPSDFRAIAETGEEESEKANTVARMYRELKQ